MTYKKPTIIDLTNALLTIQGSTNKTGHYAESQSPPNLGSLPAYEADE